jgi:hypothetical protein
MKETGTITINTARGWRQNRTSLSISNNLKNFYVEMMKDEFDLWNNYFKNEDDWDDSRLKNYWFKLECGMLCLLHIEENPDELIDSSLLEYLIYKHLRECAEEELALILEQERAVKD